MGTKGRVMLNKIVFKNNKEASLKFSNRSDFGLFNGDNQITDLVVDFLNLQKYTLHSMNYVTSSRVVFVFEDRIDLLIEATGFDIDFIANRIKKEIMKWQEVTMK